MSDDKIIRLGELIEHRLKKEKEIEYYKSQLLDLQEKIFNLQKDVDLTKLIIDIIRDEKVIDIEEKVVKAIPILGGEDGIQRSK